MKNITIKLTPKEVFVLHKLNIPQPSRRKKFGAFDISRKLYKELTEQLEERELKKIEEEWEKLASDFPAPAPPKPKKTNPRKPLPVRSNKRPSSEDMLGKF